MNLAKRQTGMSFISWLFMLVLLGLLAMFFIRLAPVYIEYFNVRSVLQSFKTDVTGYGSAQEVRSAIDKRFSINDINDVTAEDVLIEPAPGGFSLRLDYEARAPFVGNISLVASFSETAEARGSSEFTE